MASLGLYKPGQGYWVRVMTAAAIGIITFATAGWLMGQMNVLASKLPVHTWITDVGSLSGGTPKAGDKVALVRTPSGSGKVETVGTAEVLSYEPSASVVRIGHFEPAPAASAEAGTPRAEDATAFAPMGGAGNAGFSAQIKNGVRPIPAVQSIYLQGAAAAVVLVCGALLAGFFCGVKPKSVDFLISTDMEMKKVAWSTRKDITTSTLVVVGASFLLAGVLFGIDVALQYFFRAINVLQ